MIEIVLDTETTGLSVEKGHRVVEIGCIELKNQMPTTKTFHAYLNPQRKVSEDAMKVHGYTDEFLADKKFFKDVAEKEIYIFFKEKYGDWILYDPGLNKNTYLLWLLPILIFVFGGAIIFKRSIFKNN